MEFYNGIINNDCLLNNTFIDNNIDRECSNRSHTLEITRQDDKCEENECERYDSLNINIYRYKFTDDFTSELFKFSKIHQYDERKDFKEAWTNWMEENDDIVNQEYRRLKELGYDGDIFDKMFKSARYYFRKKSTEKKAPAKRRVYVGAQKDLLEAMDEHIKLNISSGDFKPSDGFDEFCKENVNILKEEITVLCRAGLTDPNEIKAKIKKTYKNRYFLAINK
jgi:hypothetical protein